MPTISALSKETVTLSLGHVLTVIAAPVSSGTIFRLGDSHGEPAQGATPISAGETKTFGPYTEIARFDVVCAAGSLSYSSAPADIPALIDAGNAAQVAGAVAPLTDSTGGTPGATLAAVGDTSAGDESEAINNNFASRSKT